MNINDIENEIEKIEKELAPKDELGKKKMVDYLWSLLAKYNLNPQESDLELADHFIKNKLLYRELVEKVSSRHNLEHLMNNDQ